MAESAQASDWAPGARQATFVTPSTAQNQRTMTYVQIDVGSEAVVQDASVTS